MIEFIGGEEKLVNVGDPIIFENKTDSEFKVNVGVIFQKSGIYEVTILGNKTIVSKVSERKIGKWLSEPRYLGDAYKGYWRCSECQTYLKLKTKYCPNCGADMRGENTCMLELDGVRWKKDEDEL